VDGYSFLLSIYYISTIGWHGGGKGIARGEKAVCVQSSNPKIRHLLRSIG
jgi:hypothetical protein